MSTPTPRQLADQAWALVETRRLPEARALFTRVCELDPGDAEAWMMRGVIQAELGETDNAIQCLNRALALDPGYADPHLHLGKIALAAGQDDTALTHAEQALERDPDYPEAWVLRASAHGRLQHYAEAEHAARRALSLAPDNHEARLSLAHALRALGRIQEAVAAYREVIKKDPRSVEARKGLGGALLAQERIEEAATAFDELLKIHPESAEDWMLSGVISAQLGKSDAAESALRRALGLRPDYIEALVNLGNAYVMQEKYTEAADAYQEALRLQPGSPEIHFNLGKALEGMGHHDKAIASYEKALGLKPDYAEAHSNLGGLYNRLGRVEVALEHHKKAVEIMPENPEVHSHIAVAYRWAGRYDEAVASCKQALRMKPDLRSAIVNLAIIHERKGEAEKAYEVLGPWLESKSGEAGIVLAFAEISGHLNRVDEAIGMLESLLQRGSLKRHETTQIHHQLGSLYDRRQRFDEAFRHYQQANRMKPGSFSAEKHGKFIDELVAVYSADAVSSLPRASLKTQLPVFVVGMPRSGTTLVEQILASHPQIFGAGELGDIQATAFSLPEILGTELNYPRCVQQLRPDVVDGLARRYLDRLREFSSTAVRIIDKMPHNFLHLGLIELLFPQARIIHVTRNALDTCLSCYFQDFSLGHDYAHDLGQLGGYFNEYKRLMKHWKAVLRIPVMDVSYEELVANQESVSRAMIDFCGLEWNDRCLRFHETKRHVATASYDQIRQPIYNKSVERWRHYEQHLAPLRKILSEAE